MRVSLLSFAVVAIPSPCCGFLSLPFINKANPALAKYADAQESALLKIHLDIGQVDAQNGIKVTGHRLGVNGLHVELRGKEDATYEQ